MKKYILVIMIVIVVLIVGIIVFQKTQNQNLSNNGTLPSFVPKKYKPDENSQIAKQYIEFSRIQQLRFPTLTEAVKEFQSKTGYEVATPWRIKQIESGQIEIIKMNHANEALYSGVKEGDPFLDFNGQLKENTCINGQMNLVSGETRVVTQPCMIN